MSEEIKPMEVGAEGVRLEGVEAPTVTALVPDSAVAGDAKDITMVVEGTGFHPRSTITFNGFDEPTKFIDATHVSTGVKPSLFKVPAECPVAVRNDGFAASAPVMFSFTEKDAPPAEGEAGGMRAKGAPTPKGKAEDDDDEAHGRRRR